MLRCGNLCCNCESLPKNQSSGPRPHPAAAAAAAAAGVAERPKGGEGLIRPTRPPPPPALGECCFSVIG